MLQRFSENIFGNAITGDFPKADLHIHCNGQDIDIVKDKKKIKLDMPTIYENYNNIVQKTYKNFVHFTADKDPKKINLMFTKKGTFLEWGIFKQNSDTIFLQRYSKGGLQAILTVKIDGDKKMIGKLCSIYNSGLTIYKKKNFKILKNRTFTYIPS